MWNTLKQPEIRPDRHAFDTPQKRSGSGVSRCSLWYIYKSCYRPPGVVRRWNQHGLWGVGLLVGLDGFESLDRDGGAGAAGEFTTEADADARSRVSKHRGRGTQWSVGSGGGLVRWGWRALAVQGLGDLRLPDPDKDRHRAVGRRPPEPGPGRPKGVSAGGRSGGVHPSTLTGCASRIGVHHNAVDAESPRSLWLAARRKGRASGQELPAG